MARAAAGVVDALHFAPVIEPTLEAGVQAMVTAAADALAR